MLSTISAASLQFYMTLDLPWTAALFIDLSKACNTVGHDTFKKTILNWFDSVSRLWFENYLSYNVQCRMCLLTF